jgi:GxxExxY protein
MGTELKYGDTTQKIIGCAMRVHSKMRNGYNEVIYSKCLQVEFEKEGLRYQKELEVPVYYDKVVVGKRRVDFMVEEKIVVELKAIAELTDQHLAQTLNYLEHYKIGIGLLINFGSKSLQFKRVINSKAETNPIHPSKIQ